jgi:hypothetical protein
MGSASVTDGNDLRKRPSQSVVLEFPELDPLLAFLNLNLSPRCCR